MLYLHVQCGNKESGNWERIKSIPLVSYENLYPEEQFEQNDSFGLLREPLNLPNGETFFLGVAFCNAGHSISFVIEEENETLLNIGTFKPRLDTFDPSVVFKTPNGLHLSFMFSNQKA